LQLLLLLLQLELLLLLLVFKQLRLLLPLHHLRLLLLLPLRVQLLLAALILGAPRHLRGVRKRCKGGDLRIRKERGHLLLVLVHRLAVGSDLRKATV
jgi:hypothetical protein